MALKMLPLNALDKQFIDDNMLTDEDFKFDSGDIFDVSLEDRNFLETIANELQACSQKQSSMPPTSIYNSSSSKNLDELIGNFIVNDLNNHTQYTTSPYSSCQASSQKDASIVNILDDASYNIKPFLSDTPPHTPSGSSDSSDSPPSCSSIDPVFVPFHAVSTLTIIPPSAEVKSISNTQKTLRPKPVQRNSNGISKDFNVSNQECIVKTANRTYLIKEPPRITASLPMRINSAGANKKHMSSNSDYNLGEVCEAAMKKKMKMARNREFAELSRKRKKDQMFKLEDELKLMKLENSNLKQENCRLKSKIADLEKEISHLKKFFPSKTAKKTGCLMVVVFMLTFNFASYSSVFEKVTPKPMKANIESHYLSRVLLWNENNSQEVNVSKSLRHKRFVQEEDPTYLDSAWTNSFNSSSCQQFINKTESLRLENDLLGWVERAEKKQKQKESKLKPLTVDVKTTLPPLPKIQLGSRFGSEFRKDVWAKKRNRNEILIYQTSRRDYEDFFNEIHRREDSFYFISFSGDHLLLPAISHNTTLRPRMSFVMPAMILNDSVGQSDDHMTMMQIDCEVMDTKLVYIKESVIPTHLRQKSNGTTKMNSKDNSKLFINKKIRKEHKPTKLLQLQSGES